MTSGYSAPKRYVRGESMTKSKPKSLEFIHENLVEVDIIKDIFLLAKACRESFYFLRSLRNLIEGQVFLKESAKEIERYFKQIDQLKKSFENLDEIFGLSDTIKDQMVRLNPVTNMETPFLYDFVKRYIELKSRMDKLQIEILDFLMGEESKMLRKLTEGRPYLSEMEGMLQLDSLVLLAFNHSSEEDRVNSYKLISKDRETILVLKLKGIDLPEIVKIRDYTFELDKKRELFKQRHESFMKLLLKSPELEEDRNIKELTKKQFSFNKQITILTYIVVLLTILTLVQGSISVFYAIKDHSKPLTPNTIDVLPQGNEATSPIKTDVNN